MYFIASVYENRGGIYGRICLLGKFCNEGNVN